MDKPVDVIGIGAINYDYMFQCSKHPDSIIPIDRATDSSSEELNWTLERVEEDIHLLNGSNYTICSTQIGGSALLAMRAVHIVNPELSIGYVGVCGEYDNFDKLYTNYIKDIESELAFIDNKEWLFNTNDLPECPERYIGKASCVIYKGSRNGIGIFPGANNKIGDYIEKNNINDSFIEYLSQAKWIHVSSLSDINIWKYVMDFVLQAKKKNRFLKLSIDPGNEFTKCYKLELQRYLQAADYVFLSPSEKENLSGRRIIEDNDINTTLMEYFGNKPIVLVFKYKNRHVLLDCSRGTPYTYSHRVLPSVKLNNDTGAGDYFAGGFIGAILSDRLIAHQPAPIEIGNIVSKARMCVNDIHEANDIAQRDLECYFEKKYKNGAINRIQKARLFFDRTENIIISLVLSLFTGIISTLIVEFILGIIG